MRSIAKYILPACLLIAAMQMSASGKPETPVPPATQSVSPEKMDQAISDTISDPEYSWRLPRESAKKTASNEITFMSMFREQIEKMFKKVGKLLTRIQKWLQKHIRDRKTPRESHEFGDWQISTQTLLFILIAVVASILALTILRSWKRRRTLTAVTATPVNVTPDIRDESVTADQLPSGEWMNMARDLLEKGELRLAVRAMFFACLITLAHHEKLTIAKYKSNREYIAELQRRAHDQPELLAAFTTNVGVIERIWYGMDSATQDVVTFFSENLATIMNSKKLPDKRLPGQATS